MIRSFADHQTERVWLRQHTKLHPNLQRRAWIKLAIAQPRRDAERPPIAAGNRLEQLRGDRAGQHSIRINQQWRLCFRWTDTGPADVEIVDYH